MNIVSRGTAYRGEPGSATQSGSFPGICVLSEGRWLVCLRAAPTKAEMRGQHVLLTWSDDEGKSWSDPVRPFDSPSVNGKPGLFHSAHVTALDHNRCVAVLYWVDHSQPDLPFFNPDTEGLLDTKIFLSHSADGGASWSEPRLLDTAPFDMPTPITGPILLLGNGEWACQFELNKHYNDTEQWRHSAVLLFSADEGNSWTDHAIAGNDPDNRVFYWDQRPGVLNDGTVLNVFWTYDNVLSAYLSIHTRISRDNGRTWSDYLDSGVPGQPAPPVQLAGNAIVLAYVDRTEEPTIKARVSVDEGKSWPEPTETILYAQTPASQNRLKSSMQDAWSEMEKFSVGLPTAVRLNEREMLAVYYAGSHTDQTAIEWVRAALPD